MGVIWIAFSVVFFVRLADCEDIVCPNGLSDTSLMTVYNQRCFQFVSSVKFWDEAKNYCWKNSGHLVTVDSQQTNNFLVQKFNELWPSENVWIGLYDFGEKLSWQWITDDPYKTESLDWTNWGVSYSGTLLRSTLKCVCITRNGDRQWHDAPCHNFLHKYPFVCEYNPGKLDVQMHSSIRSSSPRNDTRVNKLPALVVDGTSGRRSSSRQRHQQLPKGVIVNDMNLAHDNLPPVGAAGDTELLVEGEKEDVLHGHLLYVLMKGLMCLLFFMALCCVIAFVCLLCRARRRQGLKTIDALSKKRVWRAMNTRGVDSVYDSHHVVFPKAPWENEYILDESRVSGKVSSGLYVPPSDKSKVDEWSVDAVNENVVNLQLESHCVTDVLLAQHGSEGETGEHIYESIDEVRRAVAALSNHA